MGKARDQAGNIWETDAQGNAVRLIQPAQSSPMNSPFADPRLGPQVQKATNEAVASQYAPQTARADATIKTAQAANAGTVADAEARKAEADAIAAQAQAQIAQAGGPRIDASTRAKAIEGYNFSQQLQQVVDHLTQLYTSGPGATKGVEGLKDFLPTAINKNFDAEANKSRGIVGQTLGFTGGQLNTPQEAEKAVGPFIPESSNYDATIVQKIQSLQELADNGKAKAIQILGGEPDANGVVHPVAPAPPPPNTLPPGQLPPDQITNATGKTRDVIDPVLRAIGTRVGQMVASGVPGEQIKGFLRDSGVDPAGTSIDEALQFRTTPAFKTWQRQNPGAAYPIGPNFYTKPVPMTDSRALLNKTAASNVGGAALAFPVAAANSLSGGYLNDLTANPSASQAGMDLLRGQHPYASLAGDLSGQIALEASLGRIPGAQSLLASRFGRRGADALYGAYSGSGESDGDRGVGAVGGAVGGLGLGMFGRSLQRGVGSALTGIRNPDLKLLNDEGVPLTVGRIARGAGDFDPMNPATVGDEVGKGIGSLEDRFAGFPGLDAVIGTARQRGDQAFNQAAFRGIAPGVAGTGAAGLTSAKAAENAAYAKLNPVRLSVDAPFTDSLTAASQAAKGLNHHAGDVNSVVADIRQQIADGGMTGKGYQTAMQTVRKTRATLNDDVGGKAASVLDNLEQSMMGLGERQGGQIAQDLAEANAIHGRRKIIQTALRSGPAQGADEMFSPKQLNQASISNTARFGGLDRALSEDRPFYDLTHAGMKAMPNLTPDSGTAGRLLLYPLIAGAGGSAIGAAASGDDRTGGAGEGASIGTGLGLLTLAAAAGPYSRTGQKVLQKALLGERPDRLVKIGQYLRTANPKYAGMFGSALGRDYFFQPELTQAP